MSRTEIIVLGAAALLGVGGVVGLTQLDHHSTLVTVICSLAVVLAVLGFVWALWFAPRHSGSDDAAVKVGRLGKGVFENNQSASRTLYSGEEAEDLIVRDNIIGQTKKRRDPNPR